MVPGCLAQTNLLVEIWRFEPNVWTPEEQAQVEMAREKLISLKSIF